MILATQCITKARIASDRAQPKPARVVKPEPLESPDPLQVAKDMAIQTVERSFMRDTGPKE